MDRSHPRPGSAHGPAGATQGRGTSPALRGRPGAAAILAAALVTVLLGAVVLASTAAARGGGGGGGAAAAPRLPADFPADIPLPAGSLQGSTGSAGQWTVQLLVGGSAAAVQRSTESFYLAAGFTRDGNAIVRRGSERITILAAARDHSPTETNLTLGVTRSSKAGSTAGSGPVATILPGDRRVSLAGARRSGLRVRFSAPSGARSATLRAYRRVGGARRLLGTRSTTIHGATTAMAVDSAAARRRIKPGLYVLEVVLRDGAGSAGRAASTTIRVVR
ncbi:MAG: hypothetical protein QOD69_67 [Solirubrobacteraceae bacterium]|nr:hypothetical protein [Solirubrobacteraceae bacterium]